MEPERPLDPSPGSDKRQSSTSFGGAGAAAGMGLQFAISVILFLLAGQWLDRKLGTYPLFMIVLMFVGAGASFYSVYRKLVEQQKRASEKRRK